MNLLEQRRQAVLGKGYKPLTISTVKNSSISNFQQRREEILKQSHQQDKVKKIAQAKKAPLDVGKSFSSGGLQINSLGANLPANAQKVVQEQLQKRKKLDDLANKVSNIIPEFTKLNDEKLYKPFGFAKPVAQFAGGVVSGIINTPREAIKGSVSLGKNRGLGTNTWQQEAGDVAAMVQLPLLIASFGTSSVAKEGGVQAIKQVAKSGVKDAVKSVAKHAAEGGAYGFLGGLQSGKDITNLKDYAKNLLVNIGVGAGVGGGIAGVTHIVLPLGKGAVSKLGAVFIKDADKRNPTITKIQIDPKAVQNVVAANPELANTPQGKELIKASVIAQQQERHVAIIPEGDGKAKISVVDPYNAEGARAQVLSQFEKNVNDYRYNGGYSAGTRVEDAALRDIAKEVDTPLVKEYTQEKVKSAIEDGTLKPNEDGSITLYRGGEPSSNNKLMSASYDKEVAQRFADNAKTEVKEIKVKPEDIKAFIGRDEGEVLLANPKAERTFNAKGEETTNKVTVSYNSKDSQAVQKVFEEKLNTVFGDAKTQEEAIKSVDDLLKNTIERMKNDRRGLAGIRTTIQKEIKGLAGIPEGKTNYHERLQAMYDDPDVGKYLEYLETKMRELDDRILKTPEAPQPYLPKEKKVEAKSEAKKPTTVSHSSSASEPVGTGKPKESRAYKRLVEHLEEVDPETFNKVKDDPKLLYNTVNQKYDFENAAKIVEEDPAKAYRIAKQFEKAPANQRWESVNIVLADRALKEKNYAMWKDLEQSRSLAQTRAGQGIVAEKGRFDQNSPHYFVQQVLDERLTRLGKTVTDTVDMTKEAINSAKAKAVAKIDQQVDKAIKFTQKQKKTIDFAQKFLDEITCK